MQPQTDEAAEKLHSLTENRQVLYAPGDFLRIIELSKYGGYNIA
jgi:hypothetical protein